MIIEGALGEFFYRIASDIPQIMAHVEMVVGIVCWVVYVEPLAVPRISPAGFESLFR